MKNIILFYLKICHFLVVKFSVYLNRHVFVMLFLDIFTIFRCHSYNVFGMVSKSRAVTIKVVAVMVPKP